MKIKEFQIVTVESGSYRLVPEAELVKFMYFDVKLEEIFEIPTLTLAALIKNHRLARDLSHQDVADKLGISKKHVQRIENIKDKQHIKKIEDAKIIENLITLFGKKFENGMRLLGYEAK